MPTKVRYYDAATLEDMVQDPLYRFSEIRSGAVPRWVETKVCSKKEIQRLISQSDWDTENRPSQLQSKGIRAVPIHADVGRRTSSVVEWEVDPDTYLSLRQQSVSRGEETIRFGILFDAIDTISPLTGNRIEAPALIQRRLNEAQTTSAWEEKTRSGDFKRWCLSYSLNASGAIEDVRIEAKFER